MNPKSSKTAAAHPKRGDREPDCKTGINDDFVITCVQWLLNLAKQVGFD
jgi:hypothetical protein